jgi:hypothetical protein
LQSHRKPRGDLTTTSRPVDTFSVPWYKNATNEIAVSGSKTA